MKRHQRILAGLLVLLLLGAAYVWIITRPESVPITEDDGEEKPSILVYRHEPESLKRITIRRNDGTGLVLYMQDKRWTVDVNFPREEIISSYLHTAGAAATQLFAYRLIEEAPNNPGIYGLDRPPLEVDFSYGDATVTTLLIGNRTPDRNNYYVMLRGDNRVYTVPSSGPEAFDLTHDNLRNRQVKTGINNQSLQHLSIITDRETIEIVPAEPDDPQLTGLAVSAFKMTKPFIPRRVSNDSFEEFRKSIPPVIDIAAFVDDSPSNYARYGLDPPRRSITVRDSDSTLTIQTGNRDASGNIYSRINNEKKVVTLLPALVEPLFSRTAFELADKFILIINIKTVNKISMVVDGNDYTVTIEREKTGDNSEITELFYLNGKKVADKQFRSFYQSLVAPAADAVNTQPARLVNPLITIRFELDEGPVRNPVVEYMKLDRDFYAAFVNGKNEFLVSNYQLDRIRQSLDEVLEGL